ncbi:unnamed protein product [Owenia fusiformis]|uniref:Talin n=1 Tax=Owenia fusiformis TaxID=6347 RepID=A0A8S4P2Z5_OWEFU|nr:unnamed protein product [Owenia fusiformis]
MALSLKVGIVAAGITKTMQFEASMIVYDACRIIRERIMEANEGNATDFGLFLADEDPKKGVWLEPGRTLEYYLLRSGDLLEYKKKHRILRVRTLDGIVKTLQVDDSFTVSQLMVPICTRLGITNHDEYSLVYDLRDEDKEKTLTLKRDKSLAKDQKKLDEMKRKLHTDDELNWLDHSKTLRQQGIDENETLLLRRKFFFSDQNVDARDPVQLNLLYVQMRDAIINGAHPVTQDEAIQFAGFMCQIQYGDHVDHKHKPGFLELKEFLPKEYVKVKSIEKKIFGEHRKLVGMQDIDAKVKYTQLCRSLKTYGITFFLVKEKMKGKNKLAPRLLGITKDSVVRVDEKTKEIMKTWNLTTVRRWAASPNSFTLDLGDYSDSYYSVQTVEGEQIAQLIAGYIDIIMKRKKAKDHFGIEGDEESTMLEDSVSPAKATIIQHQTAKVGHASTGSVALPAVLRAGDTGQSAMSTGSMQRAQHMQVTNQAHSAHAAPGGAKGEKHDLNQPQRALWGTIDEGLSAMTNVDEELQKKADVPDLGSDPASRKWRENTMDVSKQNVGAQLSAMNAATAQVVTLTSGGDDDTDHAAVGSAVQTISTNMTDLSKDVRMLATLQDDDQDGDKLLDAARKLAGAFTDLLKAAQPGTKEPRQNLLTAASKVGEASHDLMRKVGEEESTDEDKSFQDMLLALAKAVANATAALVLKAKGVAGTVETQAQQNKVISSATQCALATSQLVACTKVVAPTIHNPACQEQLVEASKLVDKSVKGVEATAKDASKDEKSLQDLGEAANAVTKALNDLLQHIKRGIGSEKGGQQEVAVDKILSATDHLFDSLGNAPEMVKQARILAQATSNLVNSIKGQAETQKDSDQQKKLLAAAKILADATAKMVDAAKGCAGKPSDSNKQAALKQAALELRSATSVAASDALKRKIIKTLEAAAKNAASASTGLINASNGATKHNRNSASQHHLVQQCKAMADQIPKLVAGIKGTMHDPESAAAQLALIQSAQNMLQPCGKAIAASNAAAPTIDDSAAALSLNNASKNMASALSELRGALNNAQDACVSLEIDGALDQIENLEKELDEVKRGANAGNLKPLPGETAESSALQLGSTSKTVGSSMAQLLTAATQGNENYTGTAAKDTATALKILCDAVRGIAATTGDKNIQNSMIDSARDVLDKSAKLIEEAKKAVNNPNNPDNQTRLAMVAKSVSQALNNCVNCLPGQRDVDNAIKEITNRSQNISIDKLPQTKRSYQEIHIQLSNVASNLNQAAGDVVTASRGSPNQLAQGSNRYSKAHQDFTDAGLLMAGVTKDTETQSQLISSLRSMSMVSSKLLISAKSVAADPNAPNAKNMLAQAARAVTESINHMINLCTISAPGQRECDNALRRIQAVKSYVDCPNEPINDSSYYDCLEGVMVKSKDLGEAMTGISNHAKKQEVEGFCESVRNFATAVCGLTESGAQAAYLTGISDPASEPGKPGLVDRSHFARAKQAIQTACNSLTDPANSQQQVLSAATVVAKHTSALCNVCRTASSKTSNPVAKRHFVQSAKDVANSTANLVKAIKALDSDFSDANRQKCGEAATPLLKAVEELDTFASSAEFASIPAKISPKALQAQEPITNSAKSMINGACHMLEAAKQLAVHPKDPPTYMLYSNHSKTVSDSIKKLVAAIKDSAPGQRECDTAIDQINGSIRLLDQASLAAIGQNLQPRNDKPLKVYQEQLVNSAREIQKLIEQLRTAAKGEAENVGHLVSTVAAYFDPLANGAVGTASKNMNSKIQMAILDQTKTVSEAALQLTYAAKEGGGNPKATHTHAAIDEAADSMKDVLGDLLETIDTAASAAGIVSTMIDQISKSISKSATRIVVPEGAGYVDYQTSMVTQAQQIARISADMVGKSGTKVSELGPLANALTHAYNQLAKDSQGATSSVTNPEIAKKIRTAVQDLGNASMDIIKDCGNLQANPGDQFAKKDIVDHNKIVAEKAARVLASLQAGAQGTQACINAASTVSGIIGDLDTTIMFATAGTLNPDTSNEVFSDHRESILKTAKALVEDTKTLVAGAASDQEELATAAQNAVKTITRLSDVVKLGAASLSSNQPEAQVLLINAVKDVASALGDLITATKSASGKRVKDPSMLVLKDSAKVMVTNVTSLLKTVKTVEDEAARGTRALESTIEVIGQEMKMFDTAHPDRKATAEDLIRYTKPITMATAKAVSAGNSCKQEDIIIAANMGRKAVSDLLKVTKAAAVNAESQDVRNRTLHWGKQSAESYQQLLTVVNYCVQKPGPESRQQLAIISKKVAMCITELIQCAEQIKGIDYVDPHDPTVIAENELLGAARSIEAAAKKLAELKPRKAAKPANENLNFEEQILEAAKSIAAATAALVKSASAAQRELVAQGKIATHYGMADYEEDGQWSEGLISAAKLVAAATHNLCDAANAMVQGHASEEKLISSAKQVAASTAQLLVACKVKAEGDSMAMKRLQAAGNAVKRATEALVHAAQMSKDRADDEEQLLLNEGMVRGMKQVIMAQEEILIKEKELEKARRKLEVIYKAKYKDRSSPESDEGGTSF